MKTKISLFACLLIGVTLLLAACSEKSSLVTDLTQNDELNSLKSKKIPTQFAGTCTPLDPDFTAWYDATDDERVTGLSLWVTNVWEPVDEITTEIAGTAEIFVGAEFVGDDYDGKWELTWGGYQYLTSPDGSTFKIVAHAVGKGTEGVVLGLTARWKYTLNFDGTPESFMYVSKGKITEEL